MLIPTDLFSFTAWLSFIDFIGLLFLTYQLSKSKTYRPLYLGLSVIWIIVTLLTVFSQKINNDFLAGITGINFGILICLGAAYKALESRVQNG